MGTFIVAIKSGDWITMYLIGGGGAKSAAGGSAGLAATGSTLAATGFPALGMAILAVLLIIFGLILVRVAVVGRNRRRESAK